MDPVLVRQPAAIPIEGISPKPVVEISREKIVKINTYKKKKAKITKEAFDETYKFLVVLDYDRNGYNTSEAVEDLIHGYSNCEEVIKIDLNDPQKLDSGHVYIVMLKPEDSNQL